MKFESSHHMNVLHFSVCDAKIWKLSVIGSKILQRHKICKKLIEIQLACASLILVIAPNHALVFISDAHWGSS